MLKNSQLCPLWSVVSYDSLTVYHVAGIHSFLVIQITIVLKSYLAKSVS